MEKTTRGIVVPLDVGWSDIGSWEAVWETSKKDMYGNFTDGKVVLENTNNSYLRSEDRLIVGIDLDDLIVVIRSTVPPGTADKLYCYFMPEFLTEKNYINDFKYNKEWIFCL